MGKMFRLVCVFNLNSTDLIADLFWINWWKICLPDTDCRGSKNPNRLIKTTSVLPPRMQITRQHHLPSLGVSSQQSSAHHKTQGRNPLQAVRWLSHVFLATTWHFKRGVTNCPFYALFYFISFWFSFNFFFKILYLRVKIEKKKELFTKCKNYIGTYKILRQGKIFLYYFTNKLELMQSYLNLTL